MATNFKICVWSFRSTRRDAVSLWHTRVSFVQLDKQITPSQLAQAVNIVFQGPFTLSVSQLKLILINAINATSVAETFFYRQKNYQCIMIIWEKAWWGAGTTTLPCDCKQERLWIKNDALVVFGGKM